MIGVNCLIETRSVSCRDIGIDAGLLKVYAIQSHSDIPNGRE